MIVFLSVTACKRVQICKLHFSVFGQKSQNRYQAGCRAAAIACNIDHDILDLVMLFKLLEAVVEESKVAGLGILFCDRLQIIGIFPVGRIIFKTVEVDHSCITGILYSLPAYFLRHSRGHIVHPDHLGSSFRNIETFFHKHAQNSALLHLALICRSLFSRSFFCRNFLFFTEKLLAFFRILDIVQNRSNRLLGHITRSFEYRARAEKRVV